jgi:hypothetical protein
MAYPPIPTAFLGSSTVREPVGFIFPVRKVKLSSPTLSALELDAVLSEQHDFESEVTEHPVESGANVSDHIRNKPATLKLECVVSNTPIFQKEVVERMGGFRKGSPGRAEDAFATLMRLREEQQPITVATRLKAYSNMAIASISIPRDAKTGDTMRFSLVLKEIRLVESTYTSYAKEPRGKKKAALGDKAKDGAKDEGTKKRSVSAAKRLKDSGVARFGKMFGGS